MSVRDVVQAAAGVGGEKLYVEDVFSTYLYTGNGSTQTITNGIDLAGEGGMVWAKSRSDGTYGFHNIIDTERGVGNFLVTSSTQQEYFDATTITSFNADGYSFGSDAQWNTNSQTYASWTFRKAPKFFDVVTYTGDGVEGKNISHSLGSIPGCIIIKKTNATRTWVIGGSQINATNPSYPNFEFNGDFTSGAFGLTAVTDTGVIYRIPSTGHTDTTFKIGSNTDVNNTGDTYVAYLFAHNAGGFGDDGLQNVISCGSYTGNGSTQSISLGWEPQWMLIKRTDSTSDWWLMDTMRGFDNSKNNDLYPNLSDAEYTLTGPFNTPTATGFYLGNAGYNLSGATYIYIAIRRPMKTPTSGTEVFAVDTRDSVEPTFDASFDTVDAVLYRSDITVIANNLMSSRLTGAKLLNTTSTNAESSAAAVDFARMNGWSYGSGDDTNFYSWMFKRAPGFFDVVAYTGDGVAGHTVNHNLGVAPELMIVKMRTPDAGYSWNVYSSSLGNTSYLNLNAAYATQTSPSTYWNSTTPTATGFSVGIYSQVNQAAATYIAYLFASCPGVSKVGSYTGNGTSQTIDCGFSAGARFILIKRTDSTGDWYVWDTARGIVSANDPHLSLNTTAAEVTTDDSVDPDATGFIVNQNATTNINVSSASYIYLAIA